MIKKINRHLKIFFSVFKIAYLAPLPSYLLPPVMSSHMGIQMGKCLKDSPIHLVSQ